MKICFYCDTIFSIGGVQRILSVIAKQLAKEHSVTILTQDSPNTDKKNLYELESSKINFDYIKYTPITVSEYFPCKFYSLLYKEKIIPQNKITSKWYGISSFPKSKRNLLINKLNSSDYDIIIGVHAFVSLQLASIRGNLKARKVVGWMHTSYDAFFNMPGYYLHKQKKQFQYEMRNLDDIIVLSNYDQDKYNKELNLKTKVIYNPLPFENTGKSCLTSKKFISIGRMSHQTKGFDLLIKSFAQFAYKNKEWTLDIVGEGSEREFLKKQIADYKMENRIFLHPFTTNIEKYYNSSSVYILSSRWEGFPLVLLEAMDSGFPIIASDLPIVKELFENKKNALLFKNKDIESLTSRIDEISNYSEKELEEMRQASLNLSKKFKVDKIIIEWHNLINI